MRIDCGRTDEEFMSRVRIRSELEDKVAQIWCENHNKIPSALKMSTSPIGNRTDFFPNGYIDPGDAGLFFTGPKGSVSVDVEIKLRDWFGYDFRPREIDIDKCTATNRPYILIQNYQTANPFLVLVKPDDLSEIARKYDRRLHEIKRGRKWSPYSENGKFEKWYYIAPDYRIYLHVPLNTLRDVNGRYTTYGKIVKYLTSGVSTT